MLLRLHAVVRLLGYQVHMHVLQLQLQRCP